MGVLFVKLPGGYLAPVGEDAEQFIAGVKVGDSINVEVTKPRNSRFHRKALKLLRVAFEHWTPDAAPDAMRVDGIIPAKDFESFRSKILILAGHCTVVYRLDGSFTYKARSISFAKCKQIEFEAVYKRMLDVVWERIGQHVNYRTPQEMDSVVNTLLTFN